MVRGHSDKKIDTIIHNKELKFPENIALACAWILADFKGINLKIIDMKKTSSLADYYILASAENTPKARSMSESIQFHLKRHDHPVRSAEGIENAEWILLDFGDLIVHIFQETIRDIFDLDDLWKENPTLPIPEEYYFSNEETPDEKESLDPYFS